MRDPNRINEVMVKLWAYWAKAPDLRLGQIIDNARVMSGYQGDVFNMEEEDFLIGLERLLDQYRKNTQ